MANLVVYWLKFVVEGRLLPEKAPDVCSRVYWMIDGWLELFIVVLAS